MRATLVWQFAQEGAEDRAGPERQLRIANDENFGRPRRGRWGVIGKRAIGINGSNSEQGSRGTDEEGLRITTETFPAPLLILLMTDRICPQWSLLSRSLWLIRLKAR